MTDLRQGFATGGIRGVLTGIAHPVLAEQLAATDLDFIVLDLEHGTAGDSDVEVFARVSSACHVPCMFRLGDVEVGRVSRLLDAGLDGWIVPRVQSRAHVNRILDIVAFPPTGHRGAGQSWISRHGAVATDADWAEGQSNLPAIVVQIEDKAGVANVAEIVGEDRLDAVMVGPRDLSFDMGHPGDSTDPTVVAAINAVDDACMSAGRPILRMVGSYSTTSSDPQVISLASALRTAMAPVGDGAR